MHRYTRYAALRKLEFCSITRWRIPMRVQTLTLAPTLVAMAVVLSLGACSKAVDDRTAGEKVDAAVAKVEQKTDAAMAKVEEKTDQAVAAAKDGANSAENTGGKMVDATKAKVKDATITTSINAELAKDPALSALKINVDTSDGKVALKGTAPDASARDRATVLAQRVEGVTGVDNQLEIRTN